uniref:CFEM domain-containing protein n=1 Tax=Colletotrichum fructicola (strain Nara gc5) TaxID=1213859 RepID=L2FRG0_COLFN
MKSSYVLLATLGLAAAQQKFTDVIPECSVKCLTQAVEDGTKCSSIDDSQCICEATNYRNIYTVGVSCVLAACGGDVATGELLPAAAKFCREVTGGASAPPVSSASAAVSSTVSSAISAASNATAGVTGTSTRTSGATATGSGAAASGTTQAGAAAGVGSMGALGMLTLGALAAF